MQTFFLGIIAVSVVVLAVIQVGVIVYGVLLVKKVGRLGDLVETEIKPTLARVDAVAAEVTRATTLAVAQVERADQLFARLAERIDHVTTVAQDAVVEPFRQGSALLQGFRVALSVLREAAVAPRPPAPAEGPVNDDEEPMFIG